MANDRIYQLPVEVAWTSTDGEIRVAQIAVEVVYRPAARKDLTFSPTIRAAVNKDLVPSYAIKAIRLKALALDYQILNVESSQAGASLGIDYSIQPDQPNVGKSLAFAYRVTKATRLAQRGADLRVKWRVNVNTVAGRDLRFTYVIDPNVAVGVDLPFTFAAAINNIAGTDEPFTFEVEQPRSRTDLGFSWLVTLSTPSSELTFTTPLRNVRTASLTFDPITRSVRDGDLGLDAAIRSLVHGDLGLDRGLSGLIDSDLEFDYEIGTVVRRQRTAPGGMFSAPPVVQQFPVNSNLRFAYAIAGAAAAELAFSSSVHQKSSRMMRMTWRIHRSIGAESTFDAPIVDFYDWNRHVLLEEIDPDLALLG
jgi:hypothetical protein